MSQELRLGKKAQESYVEAEDLHRKLDRHAYGPPTHPLHRCRGRPGTRGRRADRVRPRHADHHRPGAAARARQAAIERTLPELRAAAERAETDRASRRRAGHAGAHARAAAGGRAPCGCPRADRSAHGTNLDLGAALLGKLASVDPGGHGRRAVLRLRPARPRRVRIPRHGRPHGRDDRRATAFVSSSSSTARTETPTLKSGQARGRPRSPTATLAEAVAWLWKFLDGARNAGELYGRVLVVFAAQHYVEPAGAAGEQASRLGAAPLAQGRRAQGVRACSPSRCCPASHVQLRRALEREARALPQAPASSCRRRREQPDADVSRHADVPQIGDAED